MQGPLVGVLALQGAFEEHQRCLEAIGCRTVQVRTPKDLENLDGIVLPGGESTAMGLIGTSSSSSKGEKGMNMWDALKAFCIDKRKPVWGTCAGMILLAQKCVGTSAVIEDGQALIGGIDITVCRNYFGSQISSFEMSTPPPPTTGDDDVCSGRNCDDASFPAVFIRAPAILSAGAGVDVLGTVVATPCRQAAVTLCELEAKIARGENVVTMGVADALEHDTLHYKVVVRNNNNNTSQQDQSEEKKDDAGSAAAAAAADGVIVLPGASDGTNARRVICAARKGNLLCTAFHPELTDDYRWHEYFMRMVQEAKA